MSALNFINGATVTATDVRKAWSKIVAGVKETHKPAYVFTNNVPEAVVLSYDSYQSMQAELEQARRDALGRQMATDLLAIAEQEGSGIPKMQVDEQGVFYEVKAP